MDEQPIRVASEPEKINDLDDLDQARLILAQLMEGGQEDNDTCQALDRLTKLFHKDAAALGAKSPSVCDILDDVCVDTILGYLDMRQAESVRQHATLTASAYLEAAGDRGAKALQKFFYDRIKRGTYDDYIVAFCVAAAMFPIAPAPTTEMFLSEGFLPSLSPLMRRKWKSRKVETACLEMLDAASMHPQCRESMQKYCTDWLEEIIDQDPAELSKAIHSADPEVEVTPGSIAMRRHSQVVQQLATVILTKMMAVPSTSQQQQTTQDTESRIQPATTSIEDLSKKFTTMLLNDPDSGKRHSIEGLAYATIRPTVKEGVAKQPELLKTLVKVLGDAPAKSPLTYGALSIFWNLTRYRPVQSEEEKKMNQLKAYANAAGKLPSPDPVDDDEHVTERCKQVFAAGLVPVLVTHSRHGSTASLSIIVSILFSLSVTTSIRGQLAQQGAVNLLIAAWSALPDTDANANSDARAQTTKRMAAQALARILISTNPTLVFGGTRARPQTAAIRPLASILSPDINAETRDLLPTFEALMALTNLASTDDDTRKTIIRTALPQIEELLLSSNNHVSKAATELICNLVQSVEGIALYAENTPQAANRIHILLALADAEGEGTRSAAGGALASLTNYEEVAKGILKRERGVEVLLGMCKEEKEELRHRGVFTVYNLLSYEGELGESVKKAVKENNGLEVLKECVKMSRSNEVVELAVLALKIVVGEGGEGGEK